jgi:hypothetical protein
MVVAGGLIFAAWIFGYSLSSTDLLPDIPEVIPGAVRVEGRDGIFVGYGEGGQILGYADVAKGSGYGGPVEVLVGVGPQGEILKVKIVQEHETPGFFKLVYSQGYLQQFTHKSVHERLQIGGDIDGISGATQSAEAIAASIRSAVHAIAERGLQTPLPDVPRQIQFGLPELSLTALFVTGYFAHRMRASDWKPRIRWGTLLAGMLVLGFIYTAPLTISHVIALLSGFWPDWHSNIYWYLLIGGILFATTVDAKNPYCSWFCPFGAYQECLAAFTGSGLVKPRRWRVFLNWLPRTLALASILLGLATRQPGVASYEPFAALFDLRGSALNFALLGVVTLGSLLMYRPFCNYLCPLGPVIDFVAAGRRWVRDLWRKDWNANSES